MSLEMSPERFLMLENAISEIRQQQNDSAKFQNDATRFQGKIEGSVRVLHYFVSLSTVAIISLCSVAVGAWVTLNGLKDKMSDFNPTENRMKLESIGNEVIELKSRVGNLETARITNSVQDQKKR